VSEWLVGVDAGGTQTRAAALDPDSGRIGYGSAEGANWTVHGPALCRERLIRAVSAALPEDADPAAVCLCLAGYYPPDHRDGAEAWAREEWPDNPVRVEPDLLAAWAGAHGGEPGVVVVAGTGSVCYGQNSAGSEARAGGWGPLFGDEGSGYELGLRCLRALAYEVDGGRQAGGLAEAFLLRWPELGNDLRAWLRGVYRLAWGREEIAGLAAKALRLAEAGDEFVRLLIAAAAHELADQARLVEQKLAEPGLPVAFHGGLMRSSYHRIVWGQLAVRRTTLRPVEARHSPLHGALLLAGDAWGGAEGRRRVRELLG
jgi:N-acetylglucosamine kinase-like BadF-type ATPase